MVKHEYFELHKLLKERIKGSIYVGINKGEATVNITGFKGITYKLRLDDIRNNKSIKDMADEIERRYHGFIMSKFLIRRYR